MYKNADDKYMNTLYMYITDGVLAAFVFYWLGYGVYQSVVD